LHSARFAPKFEQVEGERSWRARRIPHLVDGADAGPGGRRSSLHLRRRRFPRGVLTLDESIVLPAGGSAAFAISANLAAFDGVPLVASAQATLDAGSASQPGDNQAGDVDAGPQGIFSDGFDGD
jgi:hypothetical protein